MNRLTRVAAAGGAAVLLFGCAGHGSPRTGSTAGESAAPTATAATSAAQATSASGRLSELYDAVVEACQNANVGTNCDSYTNGSYTDLTNAAKSFCQQFASDAKPFFDAAGLPQVAQYGSFESLPVSLTGESYFIGNGPGPLITNADTSAGCENGDPSFPKDQQVLELVHSPPAKLFGGQPVGGQPCMTATERGVFALACTTTSGWAFLVEESKSAYVATPALNSLYTSVSGDLQ